MANVLVSVAHADGAAAIVRTSRGLSLTGYLPRPGTRLDDHRPALEGVAGE